MNRYYVWITMLTASYAGRIVGRLVKKGFTVGPLLTQDSLVLGGKDNPSALMALLLDRVEEKDIVKVRNDVKQVLADLKVKYHSIVISGTSGLATWEGSNISLKEIEDTKAKKVQQRSHLRLVPQPKKEDESKPELPA